MVIERSAEGEGLRYKCRGWRASCSAFSMPQAPSSAHAPCPTKRRCVKGGQFVRLIVQPTPPAERLALREQKPFPIPSPTPAAECDACIHSRQDHCRYPNRHAKPPFLQTDPRARASSACTALELSLFPFWTRSAENPDALSIRRAPPAPRALWRRSQEHAPFAVPALLERRSLFPTCARQALLGESLTFGVIEAPLAGVAQWPAGPAPTARPQTTREADN